MIYRTALCLLFLVNCSSKGEPFLSGDKGVIDTISRPDARVDAPVDITERDQQSSDTRPPRDFTIISDTATNDTAGCKVANDSCAKAKKLTWSGNTIVETSNTACATDDIGFGEDGCDGWLVDGTAGPDVFYEIILPPGLFEVRLTSPQWDCALYVLGSCSTGDCVDASDEINAGVEEYLVLEYSTSTKVIIGVDSYDGAEAGEFTLTISGDTPPPPDSGPPPPPDAGPDLAPDLAPDLPPDTGSSTGNIVITEIMINPDAVADTGEWIELYNAGSTTVNLKDWRIEDQPGSSQNKHVIASDVTIPAGGYLVLGRDGSSSTNGGVSVDYAYGNGFVLANTGDEIFLYDATGGLVDQVEYTDTDSWPLPTGASISLKSPGLDNNDPVNWCEETAAWSGSAGDKGTPGEPSGC